MALRDYTNVVQTPVKDALEASWYSIVGILITIFVMWLLNIALGTIGQGINLILSFAGMILIGMVGFRSSFLLNFGIFGALANLLQDKDKSQGAAAGLRLLLKVVTALAYGFVLASTTLTTWSFQAHPAGFWILFLLATLILLAQQVYGKKGDWGFYVVLVYAIVMIVVHGWLTLGKAFNPEYELFDTTNGAPLYMKEPGLAGKLRLDIETAECRVVTTTEGKKYRMDHFLPAGVTNPEILALYTEDSLGRKVFNYAKHGSCFSGRNQVRLVPVEPADATIRNPSSWGNSLSRGAQEALSGLPSIDAVGDIPSVGDGFSSLTNGQYRWQQWAGAVVVFLVVLLVGNMFLAGNSTLTTTLFRLALVVIGLYAGYLTFHLVGEAEVDPVAVSSPYYTYEQWTELNGGTYLPSNGDKVTMCVGPNDGRFIISFRRNEQAGVEYEMSENQTFDRGLIGGLGTGHFVSFLAGPGEVRYGTGANDFAFAPNRKSGNPWHLIKGHCLAVTFWSPPR